MPRPAAARRGLPPAWVSGVNPPSCVPRVIFSGAVPLLPKVTFTAAGLPSVSVADALPGVTVRGPAFSAQSWRVTEFAARFTAAAAVAYPGAAAVRVVLPVLGVNSA